MFYRILKSKIFIGFVFITLLLSLTAYRLLSPGINFLVLLESEHQSDSYHSKEVSIKLSGDRTIPARLYTPKEGNSGSIVLIHGVHYDGYNEKRLIHLTSVLTQLGYQVLTPDISDLRTYDIVPRALDDIQGAALWMLNSDQLKAKDQKIGLWGISFAGGLCLRAAASAPLRDKISSAFSFGGHGSLDGAINYLMTGEIPGGALPPHPYGQAVLLRRYAEKIVAEDQVKPLQASMLDYLKGDDDEAKAGAALLSEETRAYTDLVFNRDVAALGRALKAKIGEPSTPKSLSAVAAPPPRCSVHLLHGQLDNVIPASELRGLEAWAAQGDGEVSALISDMISHVELDEDQEEPPLMSYYEMIRFWTELLRAT